MAFTKNFAAMLGYGKGTCANGEESSSSIERLDDGTLTFDQYDPTSTTRNSTYNSGLCIGYSDKKLGDATAEYERYNLDGVINSGLTAIVATNSSSTDRLIWTFNQVITNPGTDAVKINEIGLFKGSSRDYLPVLLYYKRLNQAVVLNPGETKSFTLVINFKSFCVKDTVATV